MTARLKLPHGTQTLREIQAWALWEAPQVGGLLGPIATGAGKSLIGMLMPQCFPKIIENGIERPLRACLFLPPSLRAQFSHDWDIYSQHWRLPNLAGGKWFTPGQPVLHVVAYSELSHAKSTALLEQIKPDLVMADECSGLRNAGTSKTGRFLRFVANFPDTKFCGWDASIIATGIGDIWHLLAIALDEGSPAPLEESELRKWAMALDPSSDEGYYMPGELLRLCESGEPVRSGFQRRLVDTAGVVATEENALGIPLIFTERKPPPTPKEVEDFLKNLRRKAADGGWKRPDGEEFSEMTQVVACARQLAEGFYLRWRYPRGEAAEVIDLWFERRQAWNRELRAKLQEPAVHMDSPLLCKNAAARWYDGGCTGCARGPRQDHQQGCREVESHPLWSSYTFPGWREVEDTVYHETQAIWISDWILEDAAAWAREAPGIVWVDHPEFGQRLERLTGFRYYGGGDRSAEEILDEDGSRSIICSVEANKRGRNLQAWSRSLVVSFPSSNDTMEQLAGRTARSGQKAEQVSIDYYAHVPELENSIETAKSRAKFVKETLGTDQKLVWGTWR